MVLKCAFLHIMYCIACSVRLVWSVELTLAVLAPAAHVSSCIIVICILFHRNHLQLPAREKFSCLSWLGNCLVAL